MGALRGIRVVELAETPAGEFCGRLLGALGAEVLKIERPDGGSPTRAMAPVLDAGRPLESSGVFAFLNTDKRSLRLDVADPAARPRLDALLAGAAVILDDHPLGLHGRLGLDEEAVAAHFPSTVFCAITPFGPDAPAHWQIARPLNVFHASGWGFHTPGQADPARPPLKGAGRFTAAYEGGLDAAIAILAALWRRGVDGSGALISVSEQAALLCRADTTMGRFLNGDDPPSDDRHAYDMPGAAAAYRCRDGFIYLFMTSRAHWEALRRLADDPPWMRDFPDDWLEFGVTAARVVTFRRAFGAWVATLGKSALSEAAQGLGLPLVPLNDAGDVAANAQLRHRGFFQLVDHPVLGRAPYPALPFRLSATPVAIGTPAPLLGEHDGEAAAPPAEAVVRQAPVPDGPLAGLRVVELAKVWAGPYAGKLLAFLGAEVIKVESVHNLDEMRAYGGVDIDDAPHFLSLNQEVLSARFNLKSEEGLAQLRALIAVSDVFLNNIRPGAVERLGLGHDDLRAIRPDIVSASLKMYGNEGPLAYQTGFAPCFAALAGSSYLVGHEGEPPGNVNIRYGDATVGAMTALGILAALVHRQRSGEGQSVDVSAVEAMASMIGDSLLEHGLTGRAPQPDGNHDPDLAPHGCYRCGDGRWLSIAVGTEAEWQALCRVLDGAALAADPRFADVAARNRHRTALDEALGELTRGAAADVLAERLLRAGVPAFPSLTSRDLVDDPYLWRAGYFQHVSDARRGRRAIVGPSWRFAKGGKRISRGAPRLGEHDAHVFGDILGLSPDDVARMLSDGALA